MPIVSTEARYGYHRHTATHLFAKMSYSYVRLEQIERRFSDVGGRYEY
jgi:hypothetical protein